VDSGFGHLEQRRRLGDVETAEVPAFNHGRLPRVDSREIIERSVEREKFVGGRSGLPDRFVERHNDRVRAAAPGGVAPPAASTST
jgi:hypothetical protein